MKRVVVLDRNPEIERVADDLRVHHGVDVAVTHTAKEAVVEIAKGDVGLVVVDIESPRKGGLKLLQWMERRHDDTPVLIGVQEGDTPRLLGEFPDLVKIFEHKPIALRDLDDIVTLYTE